MKLPDVYRDWRIVFGLALVLLGAGNWIVGRARTEQYSKIIAAQSDPSADQAYRSFDELDSARCLSRSTPSSAASPTRRRGWISTTPPS